MLAQKLGEQMGQTFIVDNRPGGAGTIGADRGAEGAGRRLHAAVQPVDVHDDADDDEDARRTTCVKDFAPVALVAKAPLAIAVNKNLPVTDVKGLIAHAKANPGKLTFAIGSTGSAGHLSTELLRRAGGIEYLIVPYKGSAPAYQDLIGGQIDGFIDPILGSASYAKAGQLRVIAVTSKARVPSLPDVPTVGETVPGYEFYSWYGLWGPAKLPAEIAPTLNAEVNKALASDMREKLEQQGLLLTPRLDRRLRASSSATTWRSRRRSSPRGRSVPSEPRACDRHRQQLGHRPRDRASACWPTAGSVTGFDVAPPRIDASGVRSACVST